MRKIKKVLSIMLAIACVMSLSATAFAADAPVTGKTYTVTADVYVTKKDNFIKLLDAHLTDSSVPPVTAPDQNATLTVVDGGYNVTVTLNNETFELTTITKNSVGIGEDEKGEATATGAKVVSTKTVASKHGNRIQTITFFVPENGLGTDKLYKFDATEYVNSSAFTLLYVGEKTFPISLKVSTDYTIQ